MIFLWKTFKNLKSERRVDNADGTDFQEENFNFIVELLKVFLHPPPPLEREGFVKVVRSILHKTNLLSIEK
jgi:hypothetical protein